MNDEDDNDRGPRKVQTIARRFDKNRGRFVVVLKAARWHPGIMLLTEAPMAYAGSDVRPLRFVGKRKTAAAIRQQEQQPKPTVVDDDESAMITANNDEAARAERFTRLLKTGRSIGYILLTEVVRCRATVDDPGRSSAAYLIRDHFSYRHYFDDEKPQPDQLEAVLERVSIRGFSFFSNRPTGVGFYPLLGHIRRSSTESPNAVLLFQHSTASLYLLKPLACGDEIVLAADVDDDPSIRTDDAEPETWNRGRWLSTASVCAGVDADFQAYLNRWSVGRLTTALDRHITNIDTDDLRRSVDLVRLQFLSLAIRTADGSIDTKTTVKTEPPKITVIDDSKTDDSKKPDARSVLRAAGIVPEDAPALRGSLGKPTTDGHALTAAELDLYRFMKRIGGSDGRFSIDALMDCLRADSDAAVWRSLWLASTGRLGAVWNRALKALAASFVVS